MRMEGASSCNALGTGHGTWRYWANATTAVLGEPLPPETPLTRQTKASFPLALSPCQAASVSLWAGPCPWEWKPQTRDKERKRVAQTHCSAWGDALLKCFLNLLFKGESDIYVKGKWVEWLAVRIVFLQKFFQSCPYVSLPSGHWPKKSFWPPQVLPHRCCSQTHTPNSLVSPKQIAFLSWATHPLPPSVTHFALAEIKNHATVCEFWTALCFLRFFSFYVHDFLFVFQLSDCPHQSLL